MKIRALIQLTSVTTTLVVALGACSTAPTASPGVVDGKSTPSQLSSVEANEVTVYAIGLVGTPYRYGGNTPESGFDCSGLIGHVYKTRAGVTPPRSVSQLQAWGQSVAGDAVRTADLVLFMHNGTATHGGIYVGDGRFVHAPSSGGVVRLDDLHSKYWATQHIAFRRP